MQQDRLDNRFTLTKKLGEGFSATVRQAVPDYDPEQQFAIKIFDLESPQFNERAFRLLKQEVDATTSLDHKNIVRYIEFKEQAVLVDKNGRSRQVAFIVQELVEGGELFDYIMDDGAFSEPIVKFYARQLLQGLLHIYTKGFSHRDLKPENILLDEDYNIKLVDFGFACKLEARDGTGFSRSVVGTPGYMAPEVLAKKPYQGHYADLFSFGVILFALQSGHPPFDLA